MDTLIYEEMKIMNISYIFHFLLYIFMSILHLLSYLKIFWTNLISKYIFISTSFIDFMLLIYPAIPLFLTYRILSNKKLTNRFKNLSLTFLFISFALGITNSVSLWINVNKSSILYRECPYNYNQNNLQNFLNEINDEKENENLNDICTKRRCIFTEENLNDLYPYSYMCNYDSSDDFSIELGKTYSRRAPNNELYSTSKIIYCENLSNENLFNLNTNNDINNFMNTCSNYIMFYKCYRFNTPENFKISEEYECPDKKYVTYSYLFGIFTIILDIILSFIPWSFVFNSYKSILKINEDNMNNIERERRERNNRNVTNPSSNEYNNSSNSNNSHSNMSSSQRNDEIAQDNSKKELDRQETKTIIVGPEYSASETSSNKNKDNLSKNCSERELLTINIKKNINNLQIIPKDTNNVINKNNNNLSQDKNVIVLNNSIEAKKDILSLNINKNKILLKSNNKSERNKKMRKFHEKSNKTEKSKKFSQFLVNEKKVAIDCTLNYIKKNLYSNYSHIQKNKPSVQVLMMHRQRSNRINSFENENCIGFRNIKKNIFNNDVSEEQKDNKNENAQPSFAKIRLRKNKLSLINECKDSFEQDKNKKD